MGWRATRQEDGRRYVGMDFRQGCGSLVTRVHIYSYLCMLCIVSDRCVCGAGFQGRGSAGIYLVVGLDRRPSVDWARLLLRMRQGKRKRMLKKR